MNIEIYNYLNLINYKLAKLYKKGLYNPFSNNFEPSKEQIKERLIFSQIETPLPKFVLEEKKKIKKYFKNSAKNLNKMIKNAKKYEFLSFFDKKLNFYLSIRLKLTKVLLHDFAHSDFNENEAIEEIFCLDPIFAELFDPIFDKDCDLEKLLENLEERYNLTYAEKVKKIEKKNNKKSKERSKNIAQHALSKVSKTEKCVSKEKNAKASNLKTKKTVQEKIQSTNSSNKNTKTQTKIKEI